MKLLSTIIGLLLALAFLTASGWGVYLAFQYLNDQYQIIEQPHAAIITLGAIILILCSWIISGAIRSISGNSDRRLHPEKAMIYAHFLEIWPLEDHFQNHNAQLKHNLQELKKPMALWGSDKVIRQFDKLFQTSVDNSGTDLIWKEANKLLLAIRKDVGHENFNIGNINFKDFLKEGALHSEIDDSDQDNINP